MHVDLFEGPLFTLADYIPEMLTEELEIPIQDRDIFCKDWWNTIDGSEDLDDFVEKYSLETREKDKMIDELMGEEEWPPSPSAR